MRGFEVVFFTVTLFSIFFIVTSNPINPYTRPGIPISEHNEHETIPYNSALPTPPFTRSHLLRQRDDHLLGDGWTMHMTHADTFFPIETAATDLASFRTYVVDEVLRYSQIHPQGYKAVALTQGQLVLDWWCPKMEIPWALIHKFAVEMLKATLRGYTGQFAMRFTHVRGIAIDVVLRVGPFAVQALGMAHGNPTNGRRVTGWSRKS